MYKVMVVDDSIVAREKIKRIKLWGAGTGFHIVDEAEDGVEALEKLKGNRVDLVITDIRMPKINGIEFLRKLKETELVPYVVFVSNYGEFSYAKEGFKYGVFDYLLKPVKEDELRELLGKVKNQLEKRHTELERVASLEKKLIDQEAALLPDDYLTQIVCSLGQDMPEVVKACESLVGFISGEFENNRTFTVFVLQKILQRIWTLTLERYSWLELFFDKTSFYVNDLQSSAKFCDLKSELIKEIAKLNEVVCRFEPHDHDNIVAKVHRVVLENMSSEVSLNTISNDIHFNKAYISKIFKHKTGMTVNEYITMVKMERAKVLLSREEDRKNFELAFTLGFKDADYFNKVFKKYTGLSVVNYRKLHD